jgi:hypothetical protein
MSKRVMIGLVVAISLFVLFGTEASAATCIQYRTIGGTAVCTKWSTKGVLVEIEFKEACVLPDSEGSGECTATAFAQSNDNVAFCGSTTTGAPPIRVKDCGALVTFTGSTTDFDVTCEPKHEDKDPGGPGVGHEHHGCTAKVPLQFDPASCASCCNPANVPGSNGTCVDVTPVEMDTQVTVFAASSGDFLESAGGGSCSPESPSCTFEEHCSINPKKIQLVGGPPNFVGSNEYQCNLQCVGANCFDEGGE